MPGETGIYHRHSSYLETNVQAGLASGKVVKIEFTDQPAPDSMENGIELLDDIFEYLSGRERTFDYQTSLTVSTQHREVLERTADIPYGDTVTYGKLAASLGRKEDAEEVVHQVHDNPIPFVYPTHRVVETDSIGEFCGGREIKRKLLEIEGGSY
ncbi:MAG: methylated-DNA--[protein]-cysteine S-methyltransferase [Halobacteria archaeon]